jgi:hypothetical protein
LYKHCCLPDVILPKIASSICKCTGVESIRKIDALFPVDQNHAHEESCGLLLLWQDIAIAKAQSILTPINRQKLKKRLVSGLAATEAPDKNIRLKKMLPAQSAERAGLRSSVPAVRSQQPSTNSSSVDNISEEKRLNRSVLKNAMGNASIIHKRDKDTPALMRPVVDRLAFGNTHMALTFGPLVMENGVPG